MTTHPLWRPYDPPTDEEIAAARVGCRSVAAPIEVVAPDSAWTDDYRSVRRQVTDALGDRVLAIEHVGSTAVPGLWAKPVIDVDVTVVSSADEPAWLPDLEAAGLELRVREPEWEEHRCLRGLVPATNVHVWSPGAQEAQRHVAFRDWLRTHEGDRAAYADLKRSLARYGAFTDVMAYNNAKAGLIYDIYEQIFNADPTYAHDRRPRTV